VNIPAQAKLGRGTLRELGWTRKLGHPAPEPAAEIEALVRRLSRTPKC